MMALIAVFLVACSGENSESAVKEEQQQEVLPFITLDLDSLGEFKPVAKNWQIVGDVYVDQTKKRTFVSSPGNGILLNVPEKNMKDNLFTAFEHGDMDMELDVMMPIHSNSGLYFQGRYEIQLLDSWAKENPQHSDIGGIYQQWDKTKIQGKRGYAGHSPRINAAKAPGLWQHFKISFQAPRFDDSGKKIKNALFKEVWLNGALIHSNQEVTGPTRSGAFEDESAKGPLMIQGDHAGVAIRNIRYKLYEDKKVAFSNVKMKEYKNISQRIPQLDTLTLVREIQTDSVSSMMATGQNPQKLLVYTGILNVPNAGDYLFEMKVHRGGGAFLINGDTINNLNGDFNMDNSNFGKVTLTQGTVPFTLIYNKHSPYQRGLGLSVEGPGISKHDLHAPGSLLLNQGNGRLIALDSSEETILQRSFLMHEGAKRTHCISVAAPQKIHYSYDLASGSLLQVWSGGFLDVTKMWDGRGGQQLGVPIGIPVELHGDPDFAFLENELSNWPDSIPENSEFKQMGYLLDALGNPSFLSELKDSRIINKMIPSDTLRSITRRIGMKTSGGIWHKLADGIRIEALPQGSFAIDDKRYFVNFPEESELKPEIRNSQGKDELLIKIPPGNQTISYTIKW
jgi:hypothetical protein